MTADDRVEVQPWLAAEGRFSFVSRPRAIDLACFASLKRRRPNDAALHHGGAQTHHASHGARA